MVTAKGGDFRNPEFVEVAKTMLLQSCGEEEWHRIYEPNRPTTAEKIKARKNKYMKEYKRAKRAKVNKG
jgi:hypothetical protein